MDYNGDSSAIVVRYERTILPWGSSRAVDLPDGLINRIGLVLNRFWDSFDQVW
jgi:hypothetical protein